MLKDEHTVVIYDSFSAFQIVFAHVPFRDRVTTALSARRFAGCHRHVIYTRAPARPRAPAGHRSRLIFDCSPTMTRVAARGCG
ncbi:hypothetical protein EVAR_43490_1 [Eumeta japonica]|uniref:Uncharacterized protein n=1 Tax=Eumeta variegata TaxID=151549 RepID=A0A4C1YKR6_EUMVA|nr:hypothetical protein EVAR_43490_1 [Eumeta japonica]